MYQPYFTKEAKLSILSAIKESCDNEVFFVGTLNEKSLVNDIQIIARGNKFSVPAILDSAKNGQVVIHNHPSGNLQPSDQDINAASIFGNKGVGFYIIDNEVSNIYVVVEAFKEKIFSKIENSFAEEFLLPKGRIAKELEEKYEYREEQIEILNRAVDSFNGEKISIIEAGTGTGKTFSYLIPAVLWALENQERVVISTNTINLQEQLINKDLPLVKNALEKEFKYSLVKGMRNYLCLLRVETLNEGLFDFIDDEEQDSLNSILDWAKVTSDGSLSDLSFNPPPELWEKVSAESDSCIRARCPHYSECFFFKSRREISNSEILVANHHILFSDLAIKSISADIDNGVLPAYKRVIFDEAHNIVDAATSHFSMRATKYGIIKVLRRLRSQSKSKKLKGLISYTSSLSSKAKDNLLRDILERAEKVCNPILDRIENDINNAFDLIYNFGLLIFNEPLQNKNEINIRLTSRIYADEGWKEIEENFTLLRNSLIKLYEEIKYFLELVEVNQEGGELIKLSAELNGVNNKLYYFTNVIDTFLDRTDENYVRWFEGRAGRGDILSGIGLSPIDVSNELKEKLYSKAKTVLMTSATLSVNKNFSFQKKQIGLEDNQRLDEFIVESPFDFKKQAILLVPTDIPEPNASNFYENITNIIFDAIKISDGGALVLFTSYAALLSVFSRISEMVSDLELLKQGDLPRNKLLESFRLRKRSVLFATDSFWEGIDVAGDSLKMVIICRLPFKVPTDPVNEARVENLVKQGINPFLEYTVPQAVLKFKQGFGRLIRSKTDRGAVLVLDKRIISKPYGQLFLKSLPDPSFFQGKRKEVLNKLADFINHK
ncbi:MAG: helicase C-terminal domain-containing protein [Thermodesulfobacteriota bacterium]